MGRPLRGEIVDRGDVGADPCVRPQGWGVYVGLCGGFLWFLRGGDGVNCREAGRHMGRPLRGFVRGVCVIVLRFLFDVLGCD